MTEPLKLFDESKPNPRQPKRRKAKKLPNFLRETELFHLLDICGVLIDAAKSPSARLAAQRDRLIVHLGIYMGLRVSEISNLEIEHVDLGGRRCLVCQGKGSKDRYVPIHPKVAELLRAWINGRKAGHVLLTNRRRPMSTITVEYRMSRLGRLAGFGAKLKPHTLRHTGAVHLLESGADIHKVKEFLGHENIAVTNVYLHCTIEGLRDAVDRMR